MNLTGDQTPWDLGGDQFVDLMRAAPLDRPFVDGVAVDHADTQIAEDAHNVFILPDGSFSGRTFIVDASVLDPHGERVRRLVDVARAGNGDDPTITAEWSIENRKIVSFGIRPVMPAIEFALDADSEMQFDWETATVRRVAVEARRLAQEEFDMKRYPNHLKRFARALRREWAEDKERKIRLANPQYINHAFVKLGSTVASRYAEVEAIPVIRMGSFKLANGEDKTFYTPHPTPHISMGEHASAPVSRPAKQRGMPDVVNLITLGYALDTGDRLLSVDEVKLLTDFFNDRYKKTTPESVSGVV